ncbi:MAG: MATE family efflux transporter [Lachnoclostridium sp.]|nr:MATE family efflux transporter [Lachnospira sp.]MCM1248462.1 MATE family efflux transporter [Lachnoclostridium sp.]
MSKGISLSEHFSYQKLIRFALPSIVMMIVTSLYTVVDGLFVSNFAGKSSFASLNLVWPFLQLISAAGFMIGTGGSALAALYLGAKNPEKANQVFSMLIKLLVYSGLVISIVSFVFMRQISALLGADANLIDDCVIYGRILAVSNIFMMLQAAYQSFFITAEKPHLGLALSILAGLTNIVMDAVFVYLLRFGIWGAAFATAMSQFVGGIVPTLYFLRKNSSSLRLVKAKIDWNNIGKACSNGASEMMTNLSGAIIGLLYNFQLLKFAGENGVAAYGAIMYIAFVFQAFYFGYAMSSTSIVGYHFGADNKAELKNVLRKSLVITGITALVMTISGEALSSLIARIYVGYDRTLYEMTTTGMQLYALSFLTTGFNVFASAFFTGLNNGKVSAVISFLRTLVIQVAAIYILPIFCGLNGIWLATAAAEGVTLFLSAAMFIGNRKRYGY